MYEKTLNSNQVYSPLPTRFYARYGAGGLSTPASLAMRMKDQAFWNLIWLCMPEVDRALEIIDAESSEAYEAATRSLRGRIITPMVQLLRSKCAEKHQLKPMLKTLPPRAFVAYFKSLGHIDHPPFQDDREKLLETMESRALLAETGKLYLLNHPEGIDLGPIEPSEYERVVEPSIGARTSWLYRAYDLMKPHIKQSGYEPPEIEIELGRFLLRQYGCCYSSRDPIRVEISAHLACVEEILDTLLHEVAHGIDTHGRGHGPSFFKVARDLGFIAERLPIKPTAELTAVFQDIELNLETYPHFVAKFQ